MALTLQQIVTTDPDARGYPAMTDAQIEDDIKDPRKTARIIVPYQKFMNAMLNTGVMLNVLSAINNPASLAHDVAVLAKESLDTARENGMSGINMDNAANTSMFNNMISAGLMTSDNLTTFNALADTPASLADINQLPSFTHLDIAKIRAGV